MSDLADALRNLGEKRVRILVCMEPLNYDLPDWATDERYPADCSLSIPALGTFLGVLADVAVVTFTIGGTLIKRGPDYEDVSYQRLLALQRYVSVHMSLMQGYDSDQLSELDVAPNSVIVHSLWLLEVEHAALTLAYNLEINPDGIPVPVVYNNAAEFSKNLTSYARHARDFYLNITADSGEVADSSV